MEEGTETPVYYEDDSNVDESMEFFDMKPKRSLKQKIFIGLCCAISIMILFALFALFVTGLTLGLVFRCTTPSSSKPFDFDMHMKNTTEMQIDLKDYDTWIDRDAKMDDWIATMNKHSNYLDTSNAVITNTVRKQYEIDAGSCKSDIEYRVREFSDWEDGHGEATIDSKVNDKDMSIACTAPIAPGPSYLATSSEKCELDRHECCRDDKYSREGRIHFAPGTYSFPKQCSDMAELYPGQFENLDEEHMNKSPSKGSTSYWYERKYIGYMDDSKYEITFAIRYHSLEKAEAGDIEHPNQGEWSIRLYALNDGFSEKWNDDVYDDTLDLYDTLVNIYGEKGCMN